MKLEKWDRVRHKNGPTEAIVQFATRDYVRVIPMDSWLSTIRDLDELTLVESFQDMKKGIKSSIEVFQEDAERTHKAFLWDKEKKELFDKVNDSMKDEYKRLSER